MLGRTFGDFAIKQRLGAGGGGEVYLAQQLSLGRDAVIKVMARGAEIGSEAADRFLREARLASQLDHPFASHVYGFGTEDDGTLWIAMELVRGHALNSIIEEQGPIALPRFVPFFERLCEVLQAAHDQGIIHRDIKPANVMVISRAGRLMPKLLDLGIARRGTEPSPPEQGKGEELSDASLPSTFSGPKTPSLSTVGGEKTSDKTLSGTMAARIAESETVSLTHAGVIIGTPHYMAPEQWADASRADNRSDLYSLALLAYQCLTGELPFRGRSIRQLAIAHGTAPLPPLPDTLPRSLHDVLARGAAKKAADRYPTAIELGAAVRAASGIGVEPFALPQLEEDLRENVLSDAPQPIAEAVALLEAARTPRQQLEAVAVVKTVVTRYLAILALACRARIGPGSAEDKPEVIALLRKMATESLSNREWRALAQELCRPFSFRKAAHPLSELVSFFFADESDATPGAGIKAFQALDALGVPPPNAPDDAVHASLLKLVPALGELLQSLSFAFDYPLVVKRDETERWMGTRRIRRVQQKVLGEVLNDQPFLIDSVDMPALGLWPLVQAFSPGAGLPHELFFLDGPGRHGARMIALPAPFERQSDEVWAWVSKNIFDVGQSQEAAALAAKPPYKGLSTFTSDDADNYFGREREAESFANRLRLSPLLAVVGPSGSGKSSFILAGVLPLLPSGWRAVVSRPGATPFQTLAAKLGLTAGSLTADAVLAGLANGESLLLVIDQFEELVTLCQDPEMRQAFAALLVSLAEDKSARLKVVLTLRDDFLIKVQQLKALRERLSSALQLLGTPAKEELLRVVTAPAERVGYGFDDAALPSKMVDEVAEYPGALALLSFTASQLWELRDRHLHQMRAKTYEALGGVGGALAHHAETTLAQMTPEESGLVREAFRHLVTSQATRAVLSRKDMLDVLGNSAAAHTVLEKLVVARLLVTSEDSSGDDRVEIIHEALIVSWPRLVGWLREDAETARLRDSLRASAKQWADRGRASGLLWRKETLAEYRVWRARFPGRLTQLEEEFARASLSEEARARTIRRVLGIIAFATLAVGLVLVFRAYREADASAFEAKQRLADLRVEQARLAALDDKPFQTLLYSEEARKLGAQGTTLDYLEGRASTKLNGQVAMRNLGEAASVVVAPGQKFISAISRSGTFRMLTLPKLEVLQTLKGGGEQQSFVFTGLGSEGLLCAQKKVSAIRDGQPPSEAAELQGVLRACIFNESSRTLGAIETGGTLHFWHVGAQGELAEHRQLKLGNEYTRLVFAPGGESIFAFHGTGLTPASDARFSSLVDVGKLQVIARIPSGNDRVASASYSHDGKRVAVGGWDTRILVVSAKDGRVESTLVGHSDWVNAVAFSADDKTVVSASNDSTVRFWSPAGALLSTLPHRAGVTRVQFVDERHVLSSTSDGSLHLWLTETTAPVATLYGHVSILSADELAGHDQVISSSNDGMLRLWALGQLSAKQFSTGDEITFAMPSVDQKYVFTGPDEGKFAKWSLADGSRVESMHLGDCDAAQTMAMTSEAEPLVATSALSTICLFQWGKPDSMRKLLGHAHPIRRVAFSPDGNFLASTSADEELLIFDVHSANVKVRLKHDPSPRGVSFSHDGKLLAAGTQDGSIHVWAWQEAREVRVWKAHGDSVFSVEFTKDDLHLVTVSKDQQVALWVASSGKLISRFAGHQQVVSWGEAAPHSALIASIDWFGTVYVWDAQRGWALDQIRAGGATNYVRWLDNEALIVGLGSRQAVTLYEPARSTNNHQCRNPLAWSTSGITPREAWPSECGSTE